MPDKDDREKIERPLSPSRESKFCVIWDMDGVIADTGPYHFRAWQKVFGERGATFTEANFKRRFGQRNDTIIRSVLGNLSENEVAAIAGEKEEAFRQLVRENIRALPGAVELMRVLRETGHLMAIASSSPMDNIRLITGHLGIGEYIQAIVYGREVSEGKPSPQAFLLAARKLKSRPGQCVVIEDSIAGVAAAKTGGMRCIAVTNTNPPEKLARADLVVDSLEKVTPNDIRKLFRHPDKE